MRCTACVPSTNVPVTFFFVFLLFVLMPPLPPHHTLLRSSGSGCHRQERGQVFGEGRDHRHTVFHPKKTGVPGGGQGARRTPGRMGWNDGMELVRVGCFCPPPPRETGTFFRCFCSGSGWPSAARCHGCMAFLVAGRLGPTHHIKQGATVVSATGAGLW